MALYFFEVLYEFCVNQLIRVLYIFKRTLYTNKLILVFET